MAVYSSITPDIPFLTTANLSAKRYYAVKQTTANHVDVPTAATDWCIGIVQNAPNGTVTPKQANVRSFGPSQAHADATGAAIGVKDPVGPDNTGALVKKTTADDNIMGRAMTALASGTGTIQVFLTPGAVYRTLVG
jgi:hypothetical protein